ncbi:MAG: ABC transporter ATP-binding protein/permease [Clostridia bacterium]|nr:ABC transporter ATP-binding protein/permease [Clostridia bacterium]
MLDKNLFKLLGDNKKYIFIVVALMAIGLFASVGTTACICFAISLAVRGEKAFAAYIAPLCIAVFCVAVRYAVSRINGDLKDLLGRKVKKDLREKAYEKIVRLGVKEADGIGMAGLTQTAMEGVEQLDIYFTTYIPQFFFAMTAPVILFLITVWIDWRVALVLLAMVPAIPMSIIAVSKYAKKVFAKYWGKYISMGGEFLDSVQGLKELKIFKADARQHVKINESAEEFRKITMKVLIMQLASTTIMDTVAYGGAGLGIMMVILNLANGWGFGLGLPAVAGALFLILVAVDFFLPLRAFGSAFHVGMNGASAGRKLLAILDLEEPKWGSESVEDRNISLENVTFSYDGQRDVLKKVDMTFPEKGMTAIVGESGCGKSTVVNMIVGAFLPKEGSITVGKKDLHSLSRESYYGNLGVVSYNTYLFNESVRENFRLAKQEVTDEEIYEALKKVNLDEFIRGEGGLDKVVNEDAENLSGGQKQRLALAVSLVSDKNIYVFDEATSNIDIESEAIIMGNIKDLSKTKSVIVISHRLANVVPADNIYYMEAGEVKESGTHEQLMKKGGGYEKLYSMQKSLEEGYIGGTPLTATATGYQTKGDRNNG